MSKRTAIIDIGSNSVRIVIYEKTSHYAFHLLRESKSRVRIGEGAYLQGGILQQPAMDRAYETIKEFLEIAKSYRCRKVLSVATSALRDAPNQKIFLKRVKNNLGLSIKIIQGVEEAYLGGIAAANMLAITSGVTIDIGGGSTELARIQDNIVVETLSLNIGTVRLKELFLQEHKNAEAIDFIKQACSAIPSSFLHQDIIGIGGSIRAVSKAYMGYINYPIKVLHGFSYLSKEILDFTQKLHHSSPEELKCMGIKSDRLDVIEAGTLIYSQLIEYLKGDFITISQAGVREGRFIKDILRMKTKPTFPKGVNPAMHSLSDRYIPDLDQSLRICKTALSLFDILHKSLHLDKKYRTIIQYSARLSHIGIDLNYYDFERHSFYLILHSFYGLSHKDTLLIATLVRYHTKKKPSKAFYEKYGDLLPKNKIIKGLIFIVALSHAMYKASPKKVPFKIDIEDDILVLKSLAKNRLAIEKIEKIEAPMEIRIV